MNNETHQKHKKETRGLVPKLRFPEFQDKGEWEGISFDKLELDISDGNYSSKYPTQSDFIKTGIPFLRANNLRNGTISDEDMRFISETQHNKLIKGHLKKGDILLSTRGELGLLALVPDRHIGSNINAQLVRINTSSKLNNVFLYHLLDYIRVIGKFEALSTGTALKQLPIGKLNKLEFELPSLPEQQKIADCLSSLDELIAAHNQKLAALKIQKKGLMQQLFPAEGETVPRLRFPEFRNAGEWDKRIFGEICDIRDGTHDSPQYYPSGKPLITSKNLLISGLIDFNNVNYIKEEDFQKIAKRSAVTEGDILFGMIGTIGNPVLVRSGGFAIKNVALIKQQKELLNKYLLQFLCSQYIESKFRILNTGNSQKFISLGQIRSIDFIIPSLPEQQKIADCLSSLDELITAQTQKIEVLKTHKKGLMQQLFPAAEELRG